MMYVALAGDSGALNNAFISGHLNAVDSSGDNKLWEKSPFFPSAWWDILLLVCFIIRDGDNTFRHNRGYGSVLYAQIVQLKQERSLFVGSFPLEIVSYKQTVASSFSTIKLVTGYSINTQHN